MMPDLRIRLKNPWIAGMLAFLLPGAGHFYQGRMFKAAVYSICILGLFFTGMSMADWQAVQPPLKGAMSRGKGISVLKYAAQAGVGAPALFGLVQRERYYSPRNDSQADFHGPMVEPFIGRLELRQADGFSEGEIEGEISLNLAPQQFGGMSLTGTLEGEFQGRPVQLQLAPHVELAKPIEANPARLIRAGVVEERDGRLETVGLLAGEIPRPYWNWVSVPMDDGEEQDLHRRLGKYHELAMVFTWLAGLLNMFAVWDAVEGPAYGYGDEEPSEAA